MIELSRTRPAARFVTVSLALAGATVLAGIGGCSSNSASGSKSPGNATADKMGLGASGDGGEGSTDASVGCVGDPRGEKFALNMTHKGDSGMLSFMIVGANYMPPAVADNSWTIKVLDASGQAVNNATLTFPRNGHPGDPWMPDHGHSAVPARAMNNNDGTYTVAPLYFFMGGIWAIYVQATVGSVTDSTTFMFCVGS
jgi:hypothetical protein